MMKATIIIPTYQPNEYIYECLDAIFKQTLPAAEFETIIVLNGPKEPYYTNLKEYIANNSTHNIELLYTETPGVSNARNIAIDKAKGEYITFVDDDDIITPNFLEALLAVSSPTCVGVSNGYQFVNDIKEKEEHDITHRFNQAKGKEFSFMRYRFFLSPVAFKLIHRNIIKNARFNTSLKISEDAMFGFTISRRIKEMKCADETAIYYYRYRAGSATRKKLDKGYVFKLTFKKLWLFTKVYFSAPFSYNFPFYLTRLLASIKHMIIMLKQE